MDKASTETPEQEIHEIKEIVSNRGDGISRRQLYLAAATLAILIIGSVFTAGSQFTSLTEGQNNLKEGQAGLEAQVKAVQIDRKETLKEWGDWRTQMNEDRSVMKTQLKAMSEDLRYIRTRLEK